MTQGAIGLIDRMCMKRKFPLKLLRLAMDICLVLSKDTSLRFGNFGHVSRDRLCFLQPAWLVTSPISTSAGCALV
jgi:hypothetical protein